MKKLLVSTVAAAMAVMTAGIATATPERMVELQFADKDGLAAAAGKIGQFAGNPMIGALAAASISQHSELTNYCGAVRVVMSAEMDVMSKLGGEGGGERPDGSLPEGVAIETEPADPLAAGEVFRVFLTDKFFAATAKSQQDVEFAKSVRSLGLGVDVTDRGVDMLMTIDVVPGSELAELCAKTVNGANPLAFAGDDALFACACASSKGDCGGQVERLLGVLKKYGIKTDFLACEKAGTAVKFTLDIPFLATYAANGLKEDVERAWASEEFKNELFAVVAEAASMPETAQSVAFCLKDVKTGASASERLARTMPEAVGAPCGGVAVFSAYGIVKNALGQLLSTPGCEEGAEMAGKVLAECPPDAGADIVVMSWKDADTLNMKLRVNPAEIKGLASLAFAAVAIGDSCKK